MIKDSTIRLYITYIFLIVILLISYQAGNTHAQLIQIGEVYFPHGDIPQQPYYYDNGSEMCLIVVVKDPVLLSRPDNEGQPISFKRDCKPKYLDTLLAYSMTSGEDYFLVKNLKNKDDNSNSWGWIASDYVLKAFEPLRDENPSNPSFIKVIVKNNWRTEGGRKIKAVPILNGPGSRYDKIGGINIFRIRYAYDIRESEDGSGEYVLVGNDPELSHEAAATTISGWIKIDYTILWESRIGVYYNKKDFHERSEPVVIFRKLNELKNYIKNKDTSISIAQEDMSISKPLQYDSTRFPVIDKARGNLIEIAFIGEGFNRSTMGNISSQVINSKKVSLNEKIEDTRNRDVLFLIDGTKSMKSHFPAVRDGIEQFMKSIKNKNEQNRFRFALAVYRDYPDKNKGFHLLANMGEDIIPLLKKENAYRVKADKDFPEALFQAIDHGALQINWGEGRTRAVVVVGDHGNHEEDMYQYKAKGVGNILKQKRISFYSINVNRNPLTDFNKIFDKQVKSILSIRGGIGENFKIEKDTKGAIVKILEKIFNLSRNVARAFTDKIEGKSSKEINRTYGTQVNLYLQEIMREHGLSDQEINLSVVSQLCERGWVSKKSRDGKDQLKPWFLIDRTGMDELLGIMSGLFKNARRKSSKGFSNAVREVVKRASGDELKETERISNYLQRRYHIPFREISDVLQHSPVELEEKFKFNDNFKKRFTRTVGEKYTHLQLVVEEKTGKIHWNEKQLRWNKEEHLVEKKWWWLTTSGVSFAWIPMEYLP
ncbi:conserved hypothetical protein [Candidatus Magnetomoraceae bacterium gMMP-15]